MTRKNHSEDFFPYLRLSHLERYAKRWVDKFKKKEIPIKTIALYHYSGEFKLSKYAKYAIVFVVDEKIPEKVYSKFGAASAFHSDDDADGQKFIYEFGIISGFIDSGFQNVYKEQPESNFLSEWQFLSKISGKQMPREIMAKEPCWILYQRGAKDGLSQLDEQADELDDDDNTIEDLIKKAYSELELIYEPISKIPGSTPNAAEKWQKVASEEYAKKSSSFKLIRGEYLQDKSTYELSDTNKKRDFVGKILQKITHDKNLKSMGIIPLYDKYKKLCHNRST